MKESLLESVAGKTLAFGLEWLPLLESMGVREARRRAGRYRATHFVLASDTTRAVGLANIPQRSASATSNQVIYSAAQCVATSYQNGTWVVCLSLAPNCWWLVAVHEGVVVMRTDTVASDPESFDSIIVDLRRAYPGIVSLQSGRDNEAPSLASLAQHVGVASLLQERRGGWDGFRVRVLATVAVLGVGVTIFAITNGRDKTTSVDTLLATKQKHEQRWLDTQQAALNKVVVHGVQGTQRLLDALYAVTVKPAGWHLKQVECIPVARAWRCVAQFRRHHPATDVQALEAALPESWVLEARDLDQTLATWFIPYIGLTLAQVRIPTALENRKTWLGILQRSSLAFDRITWGEPKPVSITAPTDRQRRPLPRPEWLETYQSRTLQLSGPLRSYVLLLADLNAIRWSRARLSITEKIVPRVRASQLHLLLEGEFHERSE